MRMRFSFLGASLVAALLLFSVGTAARFVARGAILYVNDSPVIRLHGTNADERASHAAEVLDSISGTLHVIAKGSTVVANGHNLFVVTHSDSAPFNTSPASLAASRAKKIQSAETTPLLALSQTSLKLAGTTSKTIQMYGSKAAEASIECSDEQVVRVQRTTGGFTVTALSAGQATITASVPGAIKSLAVEVKPYAAIFPQQVDATVTGAPATTETVLGAIESAIHNRLKAELGTDMKLVHVDTTPVLSGETRTFTARVKAFGTDSILSEGQVMVSVRNIALPQKEEAELWYCNEPESVKALGGLFSANLNPESPARLLYHHMNATKKQMFLKVQAVNSSNETARVMIIPGDSKPDLNPVFAGIKAADQFVRCWRSGSGEVVSIPPHSSLPISLRRLNPGQTASGLCTLRLLDGGPKSVLVRADARAPFALDSRWSSALKSSAPWREVGTQHIMEFDPPARPQTDQIYPNPYQTMTAKYEVGGKFAFIRIGQKPIARQDKKDTLDGNFGVVYNITANLSNPTTQPADVEIVFESSAGYAGALVILNGDLVRTPLLHPKAEHRLMKLHLLPQGTRQISLTTVPLSGGSYPVTITIRPIGSSAKYGSTALSDRP